MSIKPTVTQHEDIEFGRGCQQLDSLFSKMIATNCGVLPSQATAPFILRTQPVAETPVSRVVYAKSHNPQPEYFTPRQLAKRWKVHVDKVLTFIRSGTLAAFNVASLKSTRPRYRISIEAVAAFERDRAAAPPPAAKQNRSSRVRRQRDRPATRTYF